MSMPAKATAAISYIGKDKTSILIRTFLARQNRRTDIYFCSKVLSDKGGEMKVYFTSDSEQNLCFQLEHFKSFLEPIKEIKKMDSEVWLMGYGSSIER